eukprot:scaffold42177_cov39-Cyclotella_meneghiniana.AAC.1
MHSPLTFPSPKRSLPPTKQQRTDCAAKSTLRQPQMWWATGLHGVGQPHKLQNTAHFNNKQKSTRPHTPNSSHARVGCFASIGRHHTLNAATFIDVVEVTMV